MRNAYCSPSGRRALALATVPLLLAGTLLATSCSSSREEVVRTQRTVEQQVIPPPRMTDIAIYDLREQGSPAPGQVNVVGTIVNRGDRPVSQLKIRLDSLDQTGRVVGSIDTPPLAQTIDANGGTATFEASVPDNPSVTTYHAVAIAR